jgi:hypothetical protein
MSEKKKHTVNEPQADYEKSEMDLLRDGLRRSYKERFLFLQQLIKIQNTPQRAKMTHKPFPKS